MKFIVETKDQNEMAMILKANDMATFIWELKHNAWREFKGTEYDYEKAWNKINQMLDEYQINIDEIIQ